MKINSSDTAKIKRAKVKVTRSNENCAQMSRYVHNFTSIIANYSRWKRWWKQLL